MDVQRPGRTWQQHATASPQTEPPVPGRPLAAPLGLQPARRPRSAADARRSERQSEAPVARWQLGVPEAQQRGSAAKHSAEPQQLAPLPPQPLTEARRLRDSKPPPRVPAARQPPALLRPRPPSGMEGRTTLGGGRLRPRAHAVPRAQALARARVRGQGPSQHCRRPQTPMAPSRIRPWRAAAAPRDRSGQQCASAFGKTAGVRAIEARATRDPEPWRNRAVGRDQTHHP